MGTVLQCRKTTVLIMKNCSTEPKMKTLFNRTENLNKFQHTKGDNQQKNSNRLQS